MSRKTEKAENLQNSDQYRFIPAGEAFCRTAHPKTNRQKTISVPAVRLLRFAQNRTCPPGMVKNAKLLKRLFEQASFAVFILPIDGVDCNEILVSKAIF
jgi:hypothetical protein